MTTTDNINLAARMRDARKRAGLKQTDLTHIASRSQIGRIERGEVYSPETIDAWADACKVSREWLRTGKEAAIVPPKVGDRWGDLTPEQRKLVPVGSVATFQTPNGPYGAVKMEPTVPGLHWGPDSPDAVPYDTDDSLMPDRHITRLGPAPAETPTEPDRSEWPVLVKSGRGYDWTPGDRAIELYDEPPFCAWLSDKAGGAFAGEFDTLAAAADAIHARLPDESEAEPFMGPPDPTPPLPGDGYYAVDNAPGYDRTVHVKIVGGMVWGHSTFDGIGGYRTIGLRLEHWYKPCMRFTPDEPRGVGVSAAPQPAPLGGVTFAQAVEIAEADGRARRSAALNVRPEVAAFALEMERKLALNDAKRGPRGWKNDEPFDLLVRVGEEADEVHDALVHGPRANVLAECADVANMAMMVADAAHALTVPASVVAPQPAPDPRDAEIATLTRRAEDAERRAAAAENEVGSLRAEVEDFRRAACVALGYGENTTPGDWTLLRDLRATDIETLRERAESAEATLDAYRIQRDQAREDAADLRRLLNEAAGLRNAAAAALDIDEGEVPADAELARRLRELAREPQDLALVRRIVAHNTDAIRRMLCEVAPGWQVAGETALGNIELCVGVERG